MESFSNLVVPAGVNVWIVVVENDSEKFSEQIVSDYSHYSRFPISYFLEPRQGIVFARNKSVTEAGNCDFCCFTDDDQIVTTDWLAELLKCQQEFDADGVAGPTKPSFSKKIPAYIEKFHQPDTYQYGTIVESAYTGCLMIRKLYLDLLEGPFDVRLNYSGGEDSFLTKNISDMGGIIRFNPDAVAYEIISDERTTIKFVVKRTFRTSNARLLINSFNNKKFKKKKVLPRLILRFCYGIIIVVPYLLFGSAEKLKGLIKIVNASGGFAFMLGRQSLFYK